MGSKKRDRKSERSARFKRAFDEVIGDPYGFPEPIEGCYSMLRNRSMVAIADAEAKSAGTVNPARPTAVDFFCDVEAAIQDGLEVWIKSQSEPWGNLRGVFDNTYFYEISPIFSQPRRTTLEQVIGRILVARSISPTAKYFTTIKQKGNR